LCLTPQVSQHYDMAAGLSLCLTIPASGYSLAGYGLGCDDFHQKLGTKCLQADDSCQKSHCVCNSHSRAVQSCLRKHHASKFVWQESMPRRYCLFGTYAGSLRHPIND
jgi:hypothetical protein